MRVGRGGLGTTPGWRFWCAWVCKLRCPPSTRRGFRALDSGSSGACVCRGALWLRVCAGRPWSAFGARACVQGGVRLGLAPCGRRACRTLDAGHPGTTRNCCARQVGRSACCSLLGFGRVWAWSVMAWSQLKLTTIPAIASVLHGSLPAYVCWTWKRFCCPC